MFTVAFLAFNLSDATSSPWNKGRVKRPQQRQKIKKPLYMQKLEFPFMFEINTSVICADCHADHLSTNTVYQTTMIPAKHKIGASYFAQNQSIKYLKPVPDAYLENGSMACISCHDGYGEVLTNDRRHILQPDSKGTLDCSACHSF